MLQRGELHLIPTNSRKHGCRDRSDATRRPPQLPIWRVGTGDHTRRNRRRYGAALMPPIVAFAQRQPVANDRPQNPCRGRRSSIIAGVLDENTVDCVGRVDEDSRRPSRRFTMKGRS